MVKNRFESLLIKHGHSSTNIQRDFYSELHKLGYINPTKALEESVYSLILPIETKKRRRGRVFISVPFPISEQRQQGVIMHGFIDCCRSMETKISFGVNLAALVNQTLRGAGPLVANRHELLRSLKFGRSFVYIRWSLF